MGALASVIAAAALFTGSPTAATGRSCDEQGTRDLVQQFVTAFNRGDVRRLDRLFARGMWWRWYAVGTAPGKRTQKAATNRQTLVNYFLARHKKRERLALVSFLYTGRAEGYAYFEYEVLRRAADMKGPQPRTYVGRGAMSCWAGRLALWGMGEPS